MTVRDMSIEVEFSAMLMGECVLARKANEWFAFRFKY